MTTWICKGALATFALTVLAACEGGPTSGLFDGIGALAPEPKAFSRADMAGGAVTLMAPQGFCIDGRSLKQRFALMARCDKLGVPSAAGAAPLGVITVSLSKAGADAVVPDQNVTAAALGLSAVSDPSGDATSLVFRATGPAPTDDLDSHHWRGTALINGQIVGLALYGPKGGEDVTGEGRAILESVIEQARTAR